MLNDDAAGTKGDSFCSHDVYGCIATWSEEWYLRSFLYHETSDGLKGVCSKVLVTHTCNTSFSGGQDKEDRGLKPAWARSSTRPYHKKPFTKIGLVEWFKVKALSSPRWGEE
jgi:hypothetical protein